MKNANGNTQALNEIAAEAAILLDQIQAGDWGLVVTITNLVSAAFSVDPFKAGPARLGLDAASWAVEAVEIAAGKIPSRANRVR